MILKTLNIVFFLLFSVSSFYSQTEEAFDDYVIPFDSLQVKEKLQFNLTMGAGFGLSNSIGNSFSTYYSPSVSYQVTPKFKINTGILYINSTVNNLPLYADYKYELFSGNISEYNAYIEGQYQLTDKLSVGGSIFYDFTNYSSTNGMSMLGKSNLNKIGYSANFKYKVAKGLTIEGELRVRDGENYNPFNRNQMSNSNSMFMGSSGDPFKRW